jgi:hypothetical protein
VNLYCGISVPLFQGDPRGVLYIFRLRLEKLLYLELSTSPDGFFKPLVDTGGGFRIETAVTKPFQKRNGYKFSSPVSSPTPGVFYTYFYNYAHRLRLEKLLHLGVSRSPTVHFKKHFWIQEVAVSLLKPPQGGFRS